MIENEQTRSSSCEKHLGVFFDSKLTFQSHIHNICKKAFKRVNATSRITPYMDFNKKTIGYKWLFHGLVQLLSIDMDVP